MSEEQVIHTATYRRVKASIIYRLLLIGLGLPMITFCAVCGVLGVFGFDLVKWNDQPVHGLMAIPTSLFIGAFITVLMTVFIGSISCLGLWVYSRFRPLKVKTVNE